MTKSNFWLHISAQLDQSHSLVKRSVLRLEARRWQSPEQEPTRGAPPRNSWADQKNSVAKSDLHDFGKFQSLAITRYLSILRATERELAAVLHAVTVEVGRLVQQGRLRPHHPRHHHNPGGDHHHCHNFPLLHTFPLNCSLQSSVVRVIFLDPVGFRCSRFSVFPVFAARRPCPDCRPRLPSEPLPPRPTPSAARAVSQPDTVDYYYRTVLSLVGVGVLTKTYKFTRAQLDSTLTECFLFPHAAIYFICLDYAQIQPKLSLLFLD